MTTSQHTLRLLMAALFVIPAASAAAQAGTAQGQMPPIVIDTEAIVAQARDARDTCSRCRST